MGSRIEPWFDADTNTLTLPRVGWAIYLVNGEKAKGSMVITEETTVTAEPKPPTRFREGTETEWTFTPGASTVEVAAEPAQQPTDLE